MSNLPAFTENEQQFHHLGLGQQGKPTLHPEVITVETGNLLHCSTHLSQCALFEKAILRPKKTGFLWLPSRADPGLSLSRCLSFLFFTFSSFLAPVSLADFRPLQDKVNTDAGF